MTVPRTRLAITLCVATIVVVVAFTPAAAQLRGPTSWAGLPIPPGSQIDGPPGPNQGWVVPTGTPVAPHPALAQPTGIPVRQPDQVPQATPTVAPTPTAPPVCGMLTDFERTETWTRGDEPYGTFAQSGEQAYSGSYSGKLSYAFPTAGNDYVVFRRSMPMGGHGNAISAWVLGDAGNHYLNCWVRDAAGEIWSFTFGQVGHTGWQQLFAPLDVTGAWPVGHVSGPANGVLDYPVSFYALALDDAPDTYTGSGVLYVDDLSCAQLTGANSAGGPASSVASGGQGSQELQDLLGVPPEVAVQNANQAGAAGQPVGEGGMPVDAGLEGAQDGQQASPPSSCRILGIVDYDTMPDVNGYSRIEMMWTSEQPLAPDEYFVWVIYFRINGMWHVQSSYNYSSSPYVSYNQVGPQSVSASYTGMCPDDLKVYHTVQVRRRSGAQPDLNDPIVCRGPVGTIGNIECSSDACLFTHLLPADGERFGPAHNGVALMWRLNRELQPGEYFFVRVNFPHGGLIWCDGTWRDAAAQLPDGTQDNEWWLHRHLCEPGASDTGWYEWTIEVRRQVGPEKSLTDPVICQSETRSLEWTGCPPPAPPPPPDEDDDEDEEKNDTPDGGPTKPK
jgi:hypothetical protein